MTPEKQFNNLKQYNNLQTPGTTKLRVFVAAAFFCSTVILAGCTVTPKRATDANLSDSNNVDADCGSECSDEDDGSRYQYYLGILSVFILG